MAKEPDKYEKTYTMLGQRGRKMLSLINNLQGKNMMEVIENIPQSQPTSDDVLIQEFRVNGKNITEAIENIPPPQPTPDGVLDQKVGPNDKTMMEAIENIPPPPSTPDHLIQEIRANDKTMMESIENILPPQPTADGILVQEFTANDKSKIEGYKRVIRGNVRNLIVSVNPDQPTKISIKRKPDVIYQISPIHSDETDVDLSDSDPTYQALNDIPKRKKKDLLSPNKHVTPTQLISQDISIASHSYNSKTSSSTSHTSSSTSDSSSSSDNDHENVEANSKKRQRKPETWKKNQSKELRNSGKSYMSSCNKKKIGARTIKPPCKDQCRYKCSENIDQLTRLLIFEDFWKQRDINIQRTFINSCTMEVIPKYKYTNAANPRNSNNAYHLTVASKKVRVCKTFFINTLDISERMIRTALTKANSSGVIEMDMRGKHTNHPVLNPVLVEDIKKHINSIPRIESHYLRANTSRQYIDGSKTVADLFRDFKNEQQSNNKELGTYNIYYKIFTNDFNLGFFSPKKDQCDLCVAFNNADASGKELMMDKYNIHHEEKVKCRLEKEADRFKTDVRNRVIVYDLQAVLQCPRGDTSAFYYKSKLNTYNFTMSELTNPGNGRNHRTGYDQVHCYVWSETDAKRGATEIGSCVLQYLENASKEQNELNITFYSDNCCGQQKNKYLVTAYMYAVKNFNIKSITHKFLIKGHTQNEADNVHSLIEKQIQRDLKSGPIYTPHQYVTIIKNSKKTGRLFKVHELTKDSFMDLKILQEEWGLNYGKNKQGNVVRWNEIKAIKVHKDDPTSFFYKYTYNNDIYDEVVVRSNRNKKNKPINDIVLKPAYLQKLPLSENKKKDLRELLDKNLIPNFYETYYSNLLA